MTMFERLSATYPMQLQSQSLQQLLLQLQLLLLLWQVGSAMRRCLAMKNVAKRHINWRYCCRSCCRCFWHLFCASSPRRVASRCFASRSAAIALMFYASAGQFGQVSERITLCELP